MGRLLFDSEGRLVGLGGTKNVELSSYEVNRGLKTSSSLDFLREDKIVNDIFSKDYWGLYSEKEKLEPLKFTNGKTQEDVVRGRLSN